MTAAKVGGIGSYRRYVDLLRPFYTSYIYLKERSDLMLRVSTRIRKIIVNKLDVDGITEIDKKNLMVLGLEEKHFRILIKDFMLSTGNIDSETDTSLSVIKLILIHVPSLPSTMTFIKYLLAVFILQEPKEETYMLPMQLELMVVE